MRILVITNLFPNPFEPTRAAFNRHQFAALAKQHDVRVIAPIAWTDELAARKKQGGSKANAPVAVERLAVEHPRFLYPPRVMRASHGRFYQWSIRRNFRRALNEFRPDLVVGTWAYPDGWAAWRLARSAGLPVVIKVHGCDVLCGGRGLASDPVKMRRTVECLTGADAVVAVSQNLADKVVELGADPSRVKTIYNGVDGSVFHPGDVGAAKTSLGLDPSEKSVVFVGRLDPVKGLDVLMRACAKLVARNVAFKCYVVGDGAERERLAADIESLNLASTVKMMGGRPQSQLGDWYRAGDVVVLPSRSEGIPGVLLEAAACARPFVASRVGGIPEIAHLAPSELVPAGDVDALANAIEKRLNTPEPAPWKPMVRSHDEGAAELTELFKEVLARHASRAGRASSPAGQLAEVR